MTADTPPRDTSAVVGVNLARLRADTRHTTRTLAAEVGATGLRMSSSGITDIERGRRAVSVDQLTALAVCLGVSPLALLTPLPEYPDAVIALTGTPSRPAASLYRWLRGEQALNDETLDAYERATFRRRSTPPWTWET
ncbi:helix-turn-helix domain-containing protein [Mycolicibacter kumamotonensis]|uniref:helix-turn-helix domain-containing protein n=1 Tax=Mycolicibacter kumamotonensis TaxID=354243 RepID=UPI0009F2A581|nr:helix-turn-helix transcriptional regulator [Mycolicibacter kumamotonensis]